METKRYFMHGASGSIFYIYIWDKEPQNDWEVDEIDKQKYLILGLKGYQNSWYLYRKFN